MVTRQSKILGLLLLCMTCTHSVAEGSSGYSVSSSVLGMGMDYSGDWEIYFLIGNNGKWGASKNGDTKIENVEAVRVNVREKEIRLYAWGNRHNGYTPQTHNPAIWKCSPGLGKNERESGGNNICLSEFADGIFIAEINQQKLLDAAQSSGLIAMAEHDYQSKLDEIQGRNIAQLAAQNRAEQDRLAEDQHAEHGNAEEKYQRGLFYLGTASYNIEAEKWMEKAAAQGHALALYKLALFQVGHYHNEAEAEKLLKRSAHAGSKEARVALDSIQAEQKRVELIEKQAAVRQIKERQQVAAFRKSVASGDESNCGPVIEVKGKLIKVATAVANYGNEHWVRRDEIYPSGWECRFINGQYQPPR